MKFTGAVLGAALLVALQPAGTAADELGWRVRAFGTVLSPNTSETVVNGDGDDIRVEGSRAFGGGGGVEYQLHRFVGVDLGVMAASPEIEIGADASSLGSLSVADSMTTTVLSAEGLLHLTPGSSVVDVYLGGGLSRVATGNLAFDILGIERLDAAAEDYFTWSLRGGLDLGFGQGSGWALSLGIRYVPGDLTLRELGGDPDDTVTLGFDILTFTAGLAYRF